MPPVEGRLVRNRSDRSNRFAASVVRAVAALACVAALVVVPGRPAASDTPPVEAGSALAASRVLTAAIVYGGFTLPMTVAESRASYHADEAQATSQGISTGIVGGSADPGCDTGGGGGTPSPTTDPPFAPITAVSSGGGQHKTTGALPIGSGVVTAKPSPQSASASTSAVEVVVPGLIEVAGKSTAEVAYADGKQRSATAGVSTDVTLLGGVVKLSGLTWEATDLTGVKDGSTGEFTVASVSVGGQKLPVGTTGQLDKAIDSANEVLTPVGIAIDLPRVTRPDGEVVVSGLAIRILGSDTLNLIVQPLFQLKAPIQDLLTQLLGTSKECTVNQLASLVGVAELVADVVLGALAGEGEIALTIGGASAGTAAPPKYTDPFAGGGTPPPVEAPKPSGGGKPGIPALGSGPAVPAAPPPAGTAPVATAPLSGAPVAYQVGCASTNPFDTDPCSSGAGTKALAGLLAGAVALFAADLYQSRRRRPIVRRSAL